MGILRKTALLLALAALAHAGASNPPAYAADPFSRYDDAASSASALAWPMDGPRATKRAAGPLVLAAPSSVDPGSAHPVPSLEGFAERLSHAQPGHVWGLFLDGRAALRVVHQPADDPTYVSSVPGTATLFRLAAEAGTLGFLAHSEAGGAAFASLVPGDTVWVIYGDGHAQAFVVTETQRYRAEERSNPYGDFIDLESGDELSAAELFQRVYGSGHGLALQTCFSHDGDLTWGRLLVLAKPIG